MPTTTPQLLADLQAAVDQLPRAGYAAEAAPLAERLVKIQASRRGPQVLGDILPIVLARLEVPAVQSPQSGDRTSASDGRPGGR